MAFQNTVLTNSQPFLEAPDFGDKPLVFADWPSNCQIQKRTLQGGVRQGVEIVEVDNGNFRFAVVPTRGMNLWKAWHGGTEIGFCSPVQGPVHPQFVPIAEPSGLGWLDGFDELIARCGLESNGAPEFDLATGRLQYPLHGRISNKPAHYVEAGFDSKTGEIRLIGIVEETRFHFCRLQMKSTFLTKLGEPGLRIIDEVTNLSAKEGEMQLLYHINFSQPLLEPGAKILAPFRAMAPRDSVAAANLANWNLYDPPSPGFAEQVYFFEPLSDSQGNTRVLLENAHHDFGVSIGFRPAQLPYFVLWKDALAIEDGYVTGLEPATNFPNGRSFEKSQGRVVCLAPGESRRFELSFAVHPNADSVRCATEEIAAIQGKTKPQIFEQPRVDWST